MKWWYVRWLECVNMVSRWNGAMFFSFSKWWNGETSIWCNGDMVKLSNGESSFGETLPSMKNREMVKKINNTMNSMVRFNCCVGYQIYLSRFDFLPACQWCTSW